MKFHAMGPEIVEHSYQVTDASSRPGALKAAASEACSTMSCLSRSKLAVELKEPGFKLKPFADAGLDGVDLLSIQ